MSRRASGGASPALRLWRQCRARRRQLPPAFERSGRGSSTWPGDCPAFAGSLAAPAGGGLPRGWSFALETRHEPLDLVSLDSPPPPASSFTPWARSSPPDLARARLRLLLRSYKGASSPPRPPEAPPPVDPRPPVVTYRGPVSGTLRGVKLLSLSTCALSLTLGPVITFYTLPGVNVVAKAAMAALMMVLSASTTAGLHWFCSPYVHRLEWRRGSGEADAEMLTWLGTTARRKIRLAGVRHADTQRPLVSFAADGQLYYVEEGAVEDEELLRKLTPPE